MINTVLNRIFDCGKCIALAVILFIPVISMISLQVLKINPVNYLLGLI